MDFCLPLDTMVYDGFQFNKEVFICDINLPVTSPDARIVEFKDSIAVSIFKFQEKTDRINLWTLDDKACLVALVVELRHHGP